MNNSSTPSRPLQAEYTQTTETTADASPNVQRDKGHFQRIRATTKEPFATHEPQTTEKSEISILLKSPQKGSSCVLSITIDNYRDELKRRAHKVAGGI